MDSAAAIVSAIEGASRDLAVPRREQARHIIGLGLADALGYLFPELEASATCRALATASS